MFNYLNIVIAPVGFKGVLSAASVAAAISEGLGSNICKPNKHAQHKVVPLLPGTFCGVNVILMPMADGGAGTVDAVFGSAGGKFREIKVHDPLGNIVNAKYLIFGAENSALIEMSSASGLVLVPKEKRDPLRSNTFGVGELILDAMAQGCGRIIIGLGDSATVDLGIGMAAALGYGFFDKNGQKVAPVPQNYAKIAGIDDKYLKVDLNKAKFIGFSDVLNPVLGKNGAVRVFGPQKGVKNGDIEKLEDDFFEMVSLMEKCFGLKLKNKEMTGSAGGLGAAMLGFLNGKLLLGAEEIAKIIKLEDHIRNADLVITGEGCLDNQSVEGKGIGFVAGLAKKHNKRCWAVVGKAGSGNAAAKLELDKVIEISPDKKPGLDVAYSLIVDRVKRESA